MQLLVLGDLHLGEDGFSLVPHQSWGRFDAIITVGDVAHSRVTVTDGKPRQEKLVGIEEARAFFQRLDDLGVPVLTVPGNHDYRRHADLSRETMRVRDLHRETTVIRGSHAFGFGSEMFDDGPEVRYDPEAVTEPDDPDAWLERTLDRAVRNDSSDTIDELRERVDEFDRQFETYRDHYETFHSLVTERENDLDEDGSGDGKSDEQEGGENSPATIGITHVPPFNTVIDRVDESVPRIGGRHWGSIALKNFLTTHDVSFVACGHIHEGEGVETVAGTPCLNAGSRSAYEVTLEDGDVSIANAEPPLE